MPIDTRCPHCDNAYRLKDEFLGRKVKCPNPKCAKPFAVEPLPPEAAPKPKPAAAPKKTAADLEKEAEALAAAMFNEEAAAAAEDTRTVDMACASCDHKFTVPFDKRGKFVVCPECGHRQKVPDKKAVKKIDWRDPNADRPSMAKGEEVPEDLRQQMTKTVSDNTLFETGVIKEEVEPVPLTVKLKRIAVVLGVVAAVAFGVLYFMQSRREGKDNRFMDDALAEADKITDDGAMKGQPPLLKAVLLMAAAEHAIRTDTPEQRKLAAERFAVARQSVDQSPRTPEREVLLGELAVLAVKFGGDEDQVGKELRLRWKPGDRGAGAQLTAGVGDVQTELKRVLTALKPQAAGGELDVRLSAVRRTARELAKTDHADILAEVLHQGFFDSTEMAEATAHVGLELFRAGNAAGAKTMAEQAKGLTGAVPMPAVHVLCEATGVPLDANAKLKAGDYYFRTFQVTQAAVNKDIGGAITVATREGSPDEKLRLLAVITDWAENPIDAATKAETVLNAEGRGKSAAGSALLRLAIAAGRAGQLDLADKLIAGIADDGLKVWAKAEAIRAKLEAGKDQKADGALIEQTTEKSKQRLGHAWAAVIVARHNAATTGDQSPAKDYATWAEPVFKGCALAGLALGIQDRKK